MEGALTGGTRGAGAETASARATGAGFFITGGASRGFTGARAAAASNMPGSGSPKDGPDANSPILTAGIGEGLREEVNRGVGACRAFSSVRTFFASMGTISSTGEDSMRFLRFLVG